MPEFETFKKRMVPLTKSPYVTIQRRGTMSFNVAAHAALGSPEAVELLYAKDDQIIGVRAIDKSVEHAYPIRAVGGNSGTASTFIVSGAAFTKYYGIDTTESKRYPAALVDDVLCLDLNAGTVVVGARSKSRNPTAAEATRQAQMDLTQN